MIASDYQQKSGIPKMQVLNLIRLLFGFHYGFKYRWVVSILGTWSVCWNFRNKKRFQKHISRRWHGSIWKCPADLRSRKGDRVEVVWRLLVSLFTPWKFNSSPMKNGGWKTILSYWEAKVCLSYLKPREGRGCKKRHSWKIGIIETSHLGGFPQQKHKLAHFQPAMFDEGRIQVKKIQESEWL